MKLLLLLFCLIIRAHAASYYLTVSGLGGDTDYESQFAKWSADLDRNLKLNSKNARVETLSGAAVTKTHVRELMALWAAQIQPDDSFALFLIGHGNFDGSDYKFNVPGPDITGGDLRSWLGGIKATRQLVVDMTSCSGAVMPLLAAKGRIVITATKSGTEKNSPVFPRYFIEAFHDSAADTDKDGAISALEAFRYTQQKVNAYFITEKLIASEHALFSDNGSTAGVREPGIQNQNGLLAGAFPLLRSSSERTLATDAPAKQKYIRHKDDLEAKIDRLKYEKSNLAEADYKQQLNALLLDLARTQAEIDK